MIETLDGTYETISYNTDNGIRTYHNKSSVSYPLHWHTAIEIISPITSNYVVHVNHDKLILKPGDILIISAGELHSIESSKMGERFIFQIDYQRLCTQNEIRYLLNIMKPYYFIKNSTDTEFSDLLCKYLYHIDDEYQRKDKYFETYLFSLFLQLFVMIGRYHLNQVNQDYIRLNKQTTTNNHNIEQFLLVCDYINQNFNMNPSLECAAMTTGYSKSHFCRFFKHFSGKSYYDYLLEVKISHAANYLSSTDKRITEIAMDCGFNSVSTFNRVFQQYYHCKPSEFRNL